MAHEHFRKIFTWPGATSLEMNITQGLTHMCRHDYVSVFLFPFNMDKRKAGAGFDSYAHYEQQGPWRQAYRSLSA